MHLTRYPLLDIMRKSKDHVSLKVDKKLSPITEDLLQSTVEKFSSNIVLCVSIRMQGIAEQMNGDIHRGGKQPRPLEDGNWICEDSTCTNVNYPRRTEVREY